MSSSKRVFKRSNNEDDDYPEFLMSPCFQITSDMQFKTTPTTGEEYLLTVIKERQTIPAITKCDKSYLENIKNECSFSQLPQTISAPDKLKPTLEWQNMQVADFSEIRMYVSRLLSKHAQTIKKVEVGRNNLAGWKHFFEKRDPTLTCLLGMKQSTLDSCLENILLMLDEIQPGNTIPYKIGQWIYAVLACKKIPLLPDSMSILRNLARKCAEIRSHLDENSESAIEDVAPLNVFICLVGRYFRQYDLAD